MAAEDGPTVEDEKPAGRRLPVTAAPSDAPICLAEPQGKGVAELLPGDVGKTVTLEAEARMALLVCSNHLCEVRCCNRCGGAIVLGGDEKGVGGIHIASMGGEPIKCGGTDCAVTCPGFTPGNRYRIQGKLRAAPVKKGPFAFGMDAEIVCRRLLE
jgi:hypothetical protein